MVAPMADSRVVMTGGLTVDPLADCSVELLAAPSVGTSVSLLVDRTAVLWAASTVAWLAAHWADKLVYSRADP